MAATPILILNSNNATNGNLSVDLSKYLDLTQGSGMDTQDPNFREALISHSLLKEGGVLALEDLKAKELIFPVRLNSTSAGGLATLIQQINMVVGSPGATYQWQDANLSQATVFDSISGQLDLEYDYRQSEKFWMKAKLRLFAQPLGRTAAPRTYAAASGVGPLLMISPYASSGALTIGQSTQAGVAGWGGAPAGASTGIFYSGSPSLAGDGPALLQISYVGPLPNGASNAATVPYAAVSILPDQYYRPLITVAEITHTTATLVPQSTVIGSQYLNLSGVPGTDLWSFAPLAQPSLPEPTVAWAGSHRLFAIARASQGTGWIQTQPGPLVGYAQSASINPSDWGLYDIGVFTLRPSQAPAQPVMLYAHGHVDLAGLVMLPDDKTWFLNPTTISGAQYGWPAPLVALNGAAASAPYTNTLLLDDSLGDQFIYSGASQSFAPSPIGSVPSSARITQYGRGLIPRPDPKNGLPIIAILGVGQNSMPSQQDVGWANNAQVYQPGASWTNQQNLRTMAQVSVIERTRYVLS